MNSPSLYTGLLPKTGSTALVGASGGGGSSPSSSPWVIFPDSTVGTQNNIEYAVPSTDVLLAGNATTTEGAGTRLAFVPAEGSFRVGTVSSTQWNADNRGHQSVAMGLNCSAIGAQSVALGGGATCDANGSFCFSSADAPTTASATNSFTVGASGGLIFYTNAARSVTNLFAAGTAGHTTAGAAAYFATTDAHPLTIGTAGGTAITVDTNQNSTFAGAIFGQASINTTTSVSADQTLEVGDNAGHSGVLYFYDAASGFIQVGLPVGGITSSYSLTLPGAQGAAGSVLTNNGSGLLTWSAGAGSNFFAQGGNAFGAPAKLGTTDNNALTIYTNNTLALTVSAARVITTSGGNTLDDASGNMIVVGSSGLTLGKATVPGILRFQGSTSGTAAITVGAVVTSYSSVWPSAAPANTNDNAALTWTSGGNLSWSVPLLSGSTGGSTGSVRLFGGTSGSFTQQAAAATTAYTVTWPAAQSTGSTTSVLANNGTGALTWNTVASFNVFQNGGNSFGAAAVLGTDDSNTLTLRTAGSAALTISTAQVASFINPVVIGAVSGSSGALTLTGATSGSVYLQSSATGALTLSTGGTPTTALTIDASQIATFFGPLVGKTTIYSGVIGSATGGLVLNSGTASGGSVTQTVGSMLAAASYTLTWPTSGGAAGTIMVNMGGGTMVWLPPSNLVQGSLSTGINNATASYVSTGLTVGITPFANTSQILVSMSGSCGVIVTAGSPTTAAICVMTIFRGATAGALTTDLAGGAAGGLVQASDGNYITGGGGYVVVDTPAVTTTVYYTAAIKMAATVTDWAACFNGGTGTGSLAGKAFIQATEIYS